jgi:large subunit ribosomal protein L27
VKKFGSEIVVAGNIIVRQRRHKIRAGKKRRARRDYTIFALIDGSVRFDRRGRRVNVDPAVDRFLILSLEAFGVEDAVARSRSNSTGFLDFARNDGACFAGSLRGISEVSP